MFSVTRGANQKMSFKSTASPQFPPFFPFQCKADGSKTNLHQLDPEVAVSTRGGGHLFFFKRANVFWMCFNNKKIGGNPICEGRGQPTIYMYIYIYLDPAFGCLISGLPGLFLVFFLGLPCKIKCKLNRSSGYSKVQTMILATLMQFRISGQHRNP